VLSALSKHSMGVPSTKLEDAGQMALLGFSSGGRELPASERPLGSPLCCCQNTAALPFTEMLRKLPFAFAALTAASIFASWTVSNSRILCEYSS